MKLAIIGAAIAGSLLALALSRPSGAAPAKPPARLPVTPEQEALSREIRAMWQYIGANAMFRAELDNILSPAIEILNRRSPSPNLSKIPGAVRSATPLPLDVVTAAAGEVMLTWPLLNYDERTDVIGRLHGAVDLLRKAGFTGIESALGLPRYS